MPFGIKKKSLAKNDTVTVITRFKLSRYICTMRKIKPRGGSDVGERASQVKFGAIPPQNQQNLDK